MRKMTTIVLVLLVMTAASAAFAQTSFTWSISGSSGDPSVHTGAPTNAVATIYLWLESAIGNGMASAEFDLGASGMSILAFNVLNGFLNAGGTTNLLLAVGACPTGPVVAGGILILDTPGNICMVPAAANGNNVTVECGTLAIIDNFYTGYSSDGSTPCFTAVESESWGSIKSLYR